MIRTPKFAMMGGAMSCVLGAGLLLQSTDNVQSRTAAIDASVPPSLHIAEVPVEPDAPVEGASLVFEQMAYVSAAPINSLPVRLAAPQETEALPGPLARPGVRNPSSLATPSANPSDECDIRARAEPVAFAYVRLELDAPCLADERVTLHHNGMMITLNTDPAGQLAAEIPALAENAVLIAAFTNGKGAVARTDVPDLADYDRVVLQWSGAEGLQLHAREFGAAYGSAGHLWSGADASRADLREGRHGMVTRLGDPAALFPQMADVYTFPSGASASSGVVSLSVEAEVTADNCGHEIAAQALQKNAGGRMSSRDIVLAVPDCDAVGDFLVLNNLVDDLTIAAR